MLPPSKTFGLRGPRDLLEKLERDVAKLCALQTTDPREMAHAAIDCAVTAWSLKDWCKEWATENGRTDLGKTKADIGLLQNTSVAYLKICRQLANGSKHFRVDQDDDPNVSSRVSSAPHYAAVGDMRCSDPLVDYVCVAKIETSEGTLRAPFFFEAVLHGWRKFMDTHQIDVR